jgi:hypothetical protein
MSLRWSLGLLGGLVLAFALAIGTLPVEAASCASFGFGYHEWGSDDPHVGQFADAEPKGSPIRKVSYDFRATNNDTGWTKRYRGTDRAVDGEWGRQVNPKVGWGFLTFTYKATAYLEDGGRCDANKHVLTDQR